MRTARAVIPVARRYKHRRQTSANLSGTVRSHGQVMAAGRHKHPDSCCLFHVATPPGAVAHERRAWFLIGSLPAATGRKIRFTGTTVLRLNGGKIAEEIGLDDGVTALQQLGLLKAA